MFQLYKYFQKATREDEEMRVLTRQIMAENQAFETQIPQYIADIENLRDEVKNLRASLSRMETQKNAAVQKTITIEKQMKASVDKVKAQEDTIKQLSKEVNELKITKKIENGVHVIKNLDSKKDDPKQKIILLENELEDQKEVSEKLKAYVGEVLENVMISNPAVLERKQSKDHL